MEIRKKRSKFVLVIFIAMFTLMFLPFPSSLAAQVSQTPPMGWNSYDSFSYSVTEAQVKANADYMAANLKEYGWEYIVIDWCWYYTGTGTGQPNQDGNFNPRLITDNYGRVLPVTARFPSSANGQGFKPLADYIHSKGLKFGIHLMRGIPRQAVAANTPIKGTNYRANDIVDRVNLCAWLNLMYGLNMSRPGAQEYLNSLFELYASWGVDFVKVDDLINPYGSPAYRQAEIEGYRKAISNCGREMVFSTSPGATPVRNGAHISQYANQWRMTNDLWDRWDHLDAIFGHAQEWRPYVGPGHWPDADMIPIGRLSKHGPSGAPRWSRLSTDEQYTLMTLWSIIRSPLMWGGNMIENRDQELRLMNNAEVMAVNQNSTNNRPVATGNTPIWCADIPGSNDKYVALFNRNAYSSNVTLNFSSIGLSGSANIRDLWAKKDIGSFVDRYSTSLASHQSRLFRIYSGPTPTPVPTTPPSQEPIFSGGPYSLNGSDEYENLPKGISNDLHDFSIACWVNLNSLDTWTRVYDFGGNSDVFMMLTPASGNTGNPYFCITTSGNSGEQGLNGNQAMPTGSWQHVAVTKNGSTGILYINGQEVDRNTSMTLHPADLGNTTNNYIGRSQWEQDPYLNGEIDSFFIYNRAISASEVSILHDTPPGETPEPTPGASLGDTNGDGSVDIVDALLTAQYYVGLEPDNFITGNGDTNCDGSIDIVDALLVAQYYVGLIISFC